MAFAGWHVVVNYYIIEGYKSFYDSNLMLNMAHLGLTPVDSNIPPIHC
jgi:hypothetical protein